MKSETRSRPAGPGGASVERRMHGNYANGPEAAIDGFAEAMRAAGVGVPDRLAADGRLHRFRGDGDKPGKRNAWYIIHLDGRRPAGAFGSWRTGASETWAAGADDRLTAAERAELRRQVAEARRQAEAERRAMQRSTAATIWREWSTAKPADPTHPHLVAKGVRPHGLRQRFRLLLVPLHDAEGRIWNIQRIAPDGAKRFAKGARIVGMFCLVGPDPDGAEAVVVAEGWATAATLYEATGLPVLAAMNAGNLEPVAKTARRWWPRVELVIAADNDHGTAGNPGLTKAKAAALATGAAVVAPPPMTGVSDWNDIGIAETRRAFSKIAVPAVPAVPAPDFSRKSAPSDAPQGGTEVEPVEPVAWFRPGQGGARNG